MSKLTAKLSERLPPMAVNALKIIGVMVALALGLFLILKLADLILPFVVAFAIASIVEPLVRVLNRRLRLSRGIASVAAVLLVVAVLAAALGFVAVRLVNEAKDFAFQLPAMYTDLTNKTAVLLADLGARYDFIDKEAIGMVNQLLDRLRTGLLSLVNTVTRGAWGVVSSVPRMVVTVVVTLLSAFFLVRDRDYIARFLHRQLPECWIRQVKSVRDDLFGALFGYVRAMLILMTVTFVELAVGFSLVGIDHAVLFAMVIAVLDALPVLGTGTFVVPWALYNLLTGHFRMAVGLLLVFAVVWMVRQLLEPRVVGNQIGIHPLLTLLSMYIGMRLLGVFGMILGPISLIVLRNLFRVCTDGRTLREMLYEGIEMPEEELRKDLPPEPEPPSLLGRAADTASNLLSKRFSRRR